MRNLVEIEGVGGTYQHRFHDAGIRSCEELLENCATCQGRKLLAQKAEISEAMLLKWVHIADLFRIKGIGQEYADLLEQAGVETVAVLARCNGENLFHRLCEINARKNLARKLPADTEVDEWIAEAKDLPRMLN